MRPTHSEVTLAVSSQPTPLQPLQTFVPLIHPDGMLEALAAIAVDVVLPAGPPAATYKSRSPQNWSTDPTPVFVPPATKSLVALFKIGEHASHGYARGAAGAEEANNDRQDASVYAVTDGVEAAAVVGGIVVTVRPATMVVTVPVVGVALGSEDFLCVSKVDATATPMMDSRTTETIAAYCKQVNQLLISRRASDTHDDPPPLLLSRRLLLIHRHFVPTLPTIGPQPEEFARPARSVPSASELPVLPWPPSAPLVHSILAFIFAEVAEVDDPLGFPRLILLDPPQLNRARHGAFAVRHSVARSITQSPCLQESGSTIKHRVALGLLALALWVDGRHGAFGCARDIGAGGRHRSEEVHLGRPVMQRDSGNVRLVPGAELLPLAH